MKRALALLLLAAPLIAFSAGADDGLRPVARDGSGVRYTGTITVSGRYERRTDDEVLGDRLCLYTEGPSARLIPRGAGDPRLPWFCFSNQAQAKELLQVQGPPQAGRCGHAGRATVTVTDYVADLAASSAHDTARLVRLVRATPPAPQDCLEDTDAP